LARLAAGGAFCPVLSVPTSIALTVFRREASAA
jgi:hypothetical protein